MSTLSLPFTGYIETKGEGSVILLALEQLNRQVS